MHPWGLKSTVSFVSPEDLWLQYIQEELGPLGQPENCSKIHWRAMKFLEGESVERFVSKYTLLQTGHWASQQTQQTTDKLREQHGPPPPPWVLEEPLAQMRGWRCPFCRSGQFLLILLPVLAILNLQLFAMNWPSTDVEKSLTLRTSGWINFHLLTFCPEDKHCCCCTDIKTVFHGVSLSHGAIILTKTLLKVTIHLSSSVCRHYQVHYLTKNRSSISVSRESRNLQWHL